MRHALNAAMNLGQQVAAVMTTWPKVSPTPTFDELWNGHADAHGNINFDALSRTSLLAMYAAMKATEAYTTLPPKSKVQSGQSFEWGGRQLQGAKAGLSYAVQAAGLGQGLTDLMAQWPQAL